MHNAFEQTNKFMKYKKFSSHMKQLNNEQKVIVDDILYQKIKNLSKPFHIFLTVDARTGKTCTFMCIIQNMLRYYSKKLQMIIL
jgi:hypothetical protein